MTEDAEIMTGDPSWHNLVPGASPLNSFYAGMDSNGALSRDVSSTSKNSFILEIRANDFYPWSGLRPLKVYAHISVHL